MSLQNKSLHLLYQNKTNKIMEALKVGDKVYNIKNHRWSNRTTYKFSEVDRLTKTQAILKDGTRLVNEPRKGFSEDKIEFSQYGDHYVRWSITTEQVIIDSEKNNFLIKALNFFDNSKFTDEEKIKIYNLFVNNGK